MKHHPVRLDDEVSFMRAAISTAARRLHTFARPQCWPSESTRRRARFEAETGGAMCARKTGAEVYFTSEKLCGLPQSGSRLRQEM